MPPILSGVDEGGGALHPMRLSYEIVRKESISGQASETHWKLGSLTPS